ncbi:hypothetical protein J6590_003941 [Homalodisca vitripennis]|nr:hypothetical protein J6590_003941 [Homalodisca vitripennis]
MAIKCAVTRGRDVDISETGGRDNYRTGRHRTLAYEHLPTQAVRPRHDKRKTDARPQLYALAAQTKRETSLTLRPDFHELL